MDSNLNDAQIILPLVAAGSSSDRVFANGKQRVVCAVPEDHH